MKTCQIIEVYIEVSDDPRNLGAHVNVGEDYYVGEIDTLRNAMSETLLDDIEHYKKTGSVEVQTTPAHVEEVFGTLYIKTIKVEKYQPRS